jgi:hypothetical protein
MKTSILYFLILLPLPAISQNILSGRDTNIFKNSVCHHRIPLEASAPQLPGRLNKVLLDGVYKVYYNEYDFVKEDTIIYLKWKLSIKEGRFEGDFIQYHSSGNTLFKGKVRFLRTTNECDEYIKVDEWIELNWKGRKVKEEFFNQDKQEIITYLN